MKKELVIPTDEDSIKWAELYRRYNKILYCMAIKDTKATPHRKRHRMLPNMI